jgi:hypothetical protein
MLFGSAIKIVVATQVSSGYPVKMDTSESMSIR